MLTIVAGTSRLSAQEKVFVANLLQFGSVPAAFDSLGKDHRIKANGMVFNFSSIGENRFFRADLSWLLHRLSSGKDTMQKDTNLLLGLDLPVFGFSYGWNIIRDESFSLGVGINIDTRSYFAQSKDKFMSMIDAFQTGVIVASKIRISDRVTYTGFYGYDFMFTNRSATSEGKRSIYTSNNFSYKFLGSLAANFQADVSLKAFKENGKPRLTNFTTYNVKFGVALLID